MCSLESLALRIWWSKAEPRRTAHSWPRRSSTSFVFWSLQRWMELQQVQGIVDYRDGLAGLVRMQFKSADVLDHGVVHLTYAVLPPVG